MSRIFISYRRGDSKWAAKALYNSLSDHFGQGRVFMDIDTLEPGVDFVRAIEDAVASCGALVAVIGTGWLDSVDKHGQPRLHNLSDYVALEISTALERDIRVVPTLIDGASMPNAEDLPPRLQMLARRNALEISEKRFEHDTHRLVSALEKAIGRPSSAGRTQPPPPPVQAAPQPAMTFGGDPFVEIAGLPGEKVFWKNRGYYGIEGDVIFRYTIVQIVLTTQRLLFIPYEKPGNPSVSGWVRPKKVRAVLPLVVERADMMSMSVNRLGDPTSLRAVVELRIADGSSHKFIFHQNGRQRIQDLEEVLKQR